MLLILSSAILTTISAITDCYNFQGWILSPAYDMNPTLNKYQCLLIPNPSNKANLKVLLGAFEGDIITCNVAKFIISELATAVSKMIEDYERHVRELEQLD